MDTRKENGNRGWGGGGENVLGMEIFETEIFFRILLFLHVF